MLRWSSQRKLAVGFGLALALLLVNSTISFVNLRHIVDNNMRVAHTHVALAELQDALSTVKDIETGQRGYVITGNPRYLEPYDAAAQRLPERLTRLDVLLIEPQIRAYLPELEREISERVATSRQIINTRRRTGFGEASRLVGLGTGKNQMDGIRRTIALMTHLETKLLEQREAESQASIRRALLTFGFASLVSLTLLALVYYMIGRDATQRKHGAEDLKAIETFSENIVDTLRAPLLMLDTNLRVDSANRAFYQTFQVTAQETEGHLIYELGNGQWDIPDLRRLLEDVVPKGAVFNDFELVHTFPIIGRRVMLLNARQLKAGTHRELLVLAMEDVTERRRAEEEIARAIETAEAATKTKSLFLANMSHELRTPLNAILGYSEMLQEEATDQGIEGFVPDLEKIQVAGRHLLSLINDILDLSKIEAGKMDLYLETFGISQLIQEVTETAGALIKTNANTLEVRYPADLGTMYADITKMRQSLLNLLSNSAKFTKEGTITLEVSRETMENREWIWFQVKDSGIGMSAEQLVKLFQTFTQADASTTRKFGGSGLGLALTRRFCQMMGGDVTVSSVPGEGSTFTIKIPATVRDIEATAVVSVSDSRPALTSGLRPEAGPLPKPGSSVLVIDDDATQRELMRRFLDSEGFHVQTANDGEEGLRMARLLLPIAITLDVMMPGMDGWTLLSVLKADPVLSGIPVIMLTMMDDKKRGYAMGAANYITKPVDRKYLAQVLKQYRCLTPPCSVLLVEDDTITRRMMRSMLEKSGWSVCEAENGRVALEKVVAERPALILLDLMMPEMDGFEFAAEMHRHLEWRNIPIVVLTAKDLTADEVLQLHGMVHTILDKAGHSRDELMLQVRDLITGLAAPLPPLPSLEAPLITEILPGEPYV